MGILMETTELNYLELVSACWKRSGSCDLFGEMEAPGEAYYTDTYHTIAINTRETEFGSIVEPIPITFKAYKPYDTHVRHINGYGYTQSDISTGYSAPQCARVEKPSTSVLVKSPVKEEVKESEKVTRPPPKKKWIKEYLEEEPKSPVAVRVVTGVSVAARSNGVVRAASPVTVVAPCPAPVITVAALEPVPAPAPPHLEFVQEHSRPSTTSNSLGLTQSPSPPSVGSNGSGSGSGSSSGSSNGGNTPRAGTREVHNKLEKNRRAHLKECFELLKRQLPATPDDKKTSNLSILGSAIRYINVLRRKERECEHEMERLAREKIAAQQRLAALKRDVTSVRLSSVRPRSIDPEEKERDDNVVSSNQILGIPISITSSPPHSNVVRMEASPPHTLNLSTKLRTLPIQITPTTSQVVRTSYGSRHNTLTLTTLASADGNSSNGQVMESGLTTPISTATVIHPAQIHLPLSQVVSSGGLVVGPAALQLLSAGGGLRVLQAPAVHTNGITENHRLTSKENGVVSPPPASSEGGVVVNGLGPLVVSQPAAHLLHTHTLTHKMVETQMVKGGVTPLTVSAQYLSATTIVKPVVLLGASSPPPPSVSAQRHTNT